MWDMTNYHQLVMHLIGSDNDDLIFSYNISPSGERVQLGTPYEAVQARDSQGEEAFVGFPHGQPGEREGRCY